MRVIEKCIMPSLTSKVLALGFIMPLLCGCVVYEERVTLDASGGAVADVRIHSDALAQLSPNADNPMLLKIMLGRSCPESVDIAAEKKGDTMHLTFTTKKVAEFLEWARAENNPLGNASVQTLDGIMDVNRTISPLRFTHPIQCPPGATMVIKLTGPGTLVTTNATRQEGDTAIWEVDPHDFLDGKGAAFNARFSVSTPWLTYLLIAMTVGAMAAFYIVLRRKTA